MGKYLDALEHTFTHDVFLQASSFLSRWVLHVPYIVRYALKLKRGGDFKKPFRYAYGTAYGLFSFVRTFLRSSVVGAFGLLCNL